MTRHTLHLLIYQAADEIGWLGIYIAIAAAVAFLT